MADVRAFRGFRYDLGQTGALGQVIAPPYDVIDAGLQAKLLAASPYNAVRVELTPEVPGDPDAKYALAAQTFRDWLDAGALRQDTARSLYVYEQEFEVEGRLYTRRGFLARVRLEPFGTGRIFPHEQTLSGPKEDRIKLYRATGFNVSPVFGLYPDDSGEVFAKLMQAVKLAPPLVAKDHLGVTQRFWVVTDQSAISAVIGLMGPKPVFIADGHHRYETGLRYLDERRAAGEATDPEAPAHFTLMMLVGMNDPGLIILPTHRLVRGLPTITATQFADAIRSHFDILSTYDTAAECWQDLELDGTQSILGFGTVADGRWTVARLKDPAALDALAPEHSADWRSLAVSILHKLVLEKLVAEMFGGTPQCQYVHLLSEVNAAVARGDHQLACLVPPATMSHVETIAGNREKMPPKSTYFYPKILTGLVYHSLRKD